MTTSKVTTTDCRSEVGVTVGLIDGIIAMARVLRKSDLSSDEVKEALKDLRSDEDIAALLKSPELLLEEVTPEIVYKEFQSWLYANGESLRSVMILMLLGKRPIVPGENPFANESPEACASHLKYLRTVPCKLD